jgi:membrane fusion protein (multidrug efflux system)
MPNRKFSRSISILSLPVIICGLLSSCGSGNGSQTPKGGGASRSLVPVEAVLIQPQLLRNRVSTTGTLLANEEVELRPEISGRVVSVLFEEGRRARKGDLLVKINDRELEAQLKRKAVEEKQATDEETRQRKLYDISAISKEDYDKSLNALHMIQADKEAIESQLAETEIRAPFDGMVGLRHVSEGGYVTPAVLVATMQDIDPMKVEFAVSEKYSRQVKSGTEIVVRVGDSEDEYKGSVYAVESKIDAGTRTVKCRARIPNPGESLIPGSFAKVEITLQEYPNAFMVPSGAIIPEINGEKVFICRNGKAKSIAVKTGVRNENSVQIVEGLAASDTLIVSGLLQLADGRGVEIKALRTN